MKILIAGGAGYVGSVLTPELLARGHDVTVIDMLWFGNYLPPEAKLIQDDLFNLTDIQLKEFDTVIFLAGLSNDPMAEFSPRLNFIGNTAGPAYLAYLAKKAGVKRFIHGGSCSVYGSDDSAESREGVDPTVSYAYGLSKLGGEDIVTHMATEDFSVICLRKGTICGHSPRMRFDLLINAMLKDVIRYGIINVNGADTWRPVLSMVDAVQAYIAAVEHAPAGLSGIFNIASYNATVIDIAGELAERFKAKLSVRDGKDVRSYRVSTTAARDLLGFTPHGTTYGIALDVMKNWSARKDILNDDRFYNIRIFKELERLSTADQSTQETTETVPVQAA